MDERIRRRYEQADFVVDGVRMTPDRLSVDYVRDDGLGLRSTDGKCVHVDWDVARTRYTPVDVYSRG